MQTRILSIVLISTAALSAGCSNPGDPAGSGDHAVTERAIFHETSEADKAFAVTKEPLNADSAVLYVNGMGCPLCATNLDLQLKRVKGVQSATVDLGVGTVAITMTGSSRPSPWRLHNAVEDAGFTLVRVQLPTGGAQ